MYGRATHTGRSDTSKSVFGGRAKAVKNLRELVDIAKRRRYVSRDSL